MFTTELFYQILAYFLSSSVKCLLCSSDDGGHAGRVYNSSTCEVEAGGSLEFEASLVNRVSSSTMRATQRKPISNNDDDKNNDTNKIS